MNWIKSAFDLACASDDEVIPLEDAIAEIEQARVSKSMI
jgi:hypothetical protein